MFPIATTLGGTCMAMPDVCKTPPWAVPVPYPNIGNLTLANPGTCSTKVRIGGAAAILQSSLLTLSNGDEAGAMGGVLSQTVMGPVQFTTGTMVVKIEGRPAAHQGSMSGHNGMPANAPGGVVQMVANQVVRGS